MVSVVAKRRTGILPSRKTAEARAYRETYCRGGETHPSPNGHRRILAAVRARDADALVGELDAHRERALLAVGAILRG
jgi:DNA-binding GntR family transcriptional regulator